MLTNAAAKRYAKALYELAVEKDVLDQLESELTAVVKQIQDVPELRTVINNPRIIEKDKKAILQQIFAGQVSEITMNFLSLLVDKRREVLLEDILTEYVELANISRGMVKAVAKTAVPLTAEQIANMQAKLAARTGKQVVLSTEVDPKIVGGVVLRIGDKIIDSSIATKLAKLKSKLENIQVSELGVRS